MTARTMIRSTSAPYSHGLDVVDTLAATGNWGIDVGPERDRIIWARLAWPTGLRAQRTTARELVSGICQYERRSRR
jgi:hypothetical protein